MLDRRSQELVYWVIKAHWACKSNPVAISLFKKARGNKAGPCETLDTYIKLEALIYLGLSISVVEAASSSSSSRQHLLKIHNHGCRVMLLSLPLLPTLLYLNLSLIL